MTVLPHLIMLQGPTIFPIAFAAIAARTLKSIGRISAEHGIKLETLQSLLSSLTLFSTFANPLNCRRITLITIILMALWSFSPIGGQASLRVVFRDNQTSTAPVSLRYMDTGPAGVLYTGFTYREATWVALGGSLPSSLSTMYAAALLQGTTTKLGPQDAWGNVKIPRIESLDSSTADSNGWMPFANASVESYSSLLGIPLVGTPNTGFVGFTVESSYVTLSCQSINSNHTKLSFPDTAQFNVSCSACRRGHIPTFESGMVDRVRDLLGVNFTSANASELFSQILTFTSLDLSQGTIAKVDCSVAQSHVETMINCTAGSCVPTAIRRSLTDYRPTNVTPFDYWGPGALEGINIASKGGTESSSPTAFFLHDSSVLPVPPVSPDSIKYFVNLSSIPHDLFAARASMLLNTYLSLLMSSNGFAGNLPAANLSTYGPLFDVPATVLNPSEVPFNNTDWDPNEGSGPAWLVQLRSPFIGAEAKASHVQVVEVYRADYVWVAVLFVASVTLLCFGVVGIVLEQFTRAPDLFDPVAALTFDNPYLGVPSVGTTMDCFARVCALKGLKVKIGDVWAEREVGKIGLGRKGLVGKLKRGKLFE